MTRASLRTWVVPAYVFLCLLIGGSAQGAWGNMILQLFGLTIIGWALVARPAEPMVPAARQLMALVLVGVAVVLLQLVPLPPKLWASLGGRGIIAEGFSTLGLSSPWQPWSLAPYRTLDAVLGAIPPVAVLLGVFRLGAIRPAYAAIAILAGAGAGIGLSALQIAAAGSGSGAWYPYATTNLGAGVGFFANANHMASLLLVAIPFLAALAAGARGFAVQRYRVALAIAAGAGILIMAGIALNGSLAGYGLVIPVSLASLVILFPTNTHLRRFAPVAAVLVALAGLAALAMTDIGRSRIGAESETSVTSRLDILAPTIALAKDFAPLGTGVGTFRDVYPLAEDPADVGTVYVIHAHNDYAEWLMEGGVPALVIMLLFFAWWGWNVVAAWTTRSSPAFARAAAIASAALLLHSVVDFPLRTSALVAVFALCLALLADRRTRAIAEPGDLRPTRHVTLG